MYLLGFWIFFVFAMVPELVPVALESVIATLSEPMFLYFIPFVPLISRLVIFVKYFDVRNEALTEAQMARESTRASILALAGFSFTGVIGISVLDAATSRQFKLPVFYLMISFLCYLIALNMQDYKYLVGREEISATLIDMATLSLISTTVAIVLMANYGGYFSLVVFIFALGGWLLDHVIRVRYAWQDLKEIRELKGRT